MPKEPIILDYVRKSPHLRRFNSLADSQYRISSALSVPRNGLKSFGRDQRGRGRLHFY